MTKKTEGSEKEREDRKEKMEIALKSPLLQDFDV